MKALNDNSLNILFVCPGYKPAYRHGGPVVSISSLAERLANKGHRVRVFTTNSNIDQDLDILTDQPLCVDGVEVWYFQRTDFIRDHLSFIPYLSRSMGWHYSPRMKYELERIVPQVDLVHTQMPFVFPTFAAARAAIRFGKPLFYSQRGILDPAHLRFRSIKKRIYIGLIEQSLLKAATTLIALTEAEVSSYRRLGLVNPCRIIPNGIDPLLYRQLPSGELPAGWDIRPETLLLAFMGRLHPTKGVSELVSAFAKTVARFPNCKLIIAGPDELGYGPKLRSQIRNLGLENHIILPGLVTGETKVNLLARADLLCLPSHAEGFSITVLEALASSTPVLISPGCNFADVERVGAGCVAAPEPRAIEAALIRLLGAPDLLVRMGRAGQRFVTENYSWDGIANRLVDVYREGIRSRAVGATV
jgi:glycosyltransferase involved in cell wall biosynthesis